MRPYPGWNTPGFVQVHRKSERLFVGIGLPDVGEFAAESTDHRLGAPNIDGYQPLPGIRVSYEYW